MVKRYWIRIEHDSHGNPMEDSIGENSEGEWVKYEDIKHLLEPKLDTKASKEKLKEAHRELDLSAELDTTLAMNLGLCDDCNCRNSCPTKEDKLPCAESPTLVRVSRERRTEKDILWALEDIVRVV